MNTAYKLLFLCTGNSARSIFGEYLLRRLGGSRFQVYSAGASPTGKVNPFAIQVLSDGFHIDASAARSKSWEEFKDVEFDFVITVCDNARETCPVWPGQSIIAHWSNPEPAVVEGSDEQKYRAFKEVAFQINRRFVVLSILWGWRVDKIAPDRFDLIGGAVALAGVFIIMYSPRNA